MTTRHGKIILGLMLVVLLAEAAFAQSGKTYTGKITEIAKGTELDLNKRDIFYIIRLEEYPYVKFRLTPDDAVRFGVIEASGPTGVVTPKMSKGMGWKVKLTCDTKNYGEIKFPVYKVTSLVRLDH